MINNKVESIKAHVKAISDILGIETTQSNENTPLRVAKMLVNELFENRNNANLEELNGRMKTFDNEQGDDYIACDNPITVSDIPFYSMCEHHWLPFHGTVSVSYIPKDTIIGLSKIPRVVKFFSRKPQLQERLTEEIAQYLFYWIEPYYLKVTITAEHMCMRMRGIESEGKTTTIAELHSDEE